PARLRQSHRLSTKLRGKGLLPVCHRNPPPSGKELSTFAEQVQTRAIVALASEYGRYGYRRVTALLQADGWQVGKDRVQRIWRRE
ncbi:IS3 family transposase, partial [Methylobacterium sp. D54C]